MNSSPIASRYESMKFRTLRKHRHRLSHDTSIRAYSLWRDLFLFAGDGNKTGSLSSSLVLPQCRQAGEIPNIHGIAPVHLIEWVHRPRELTPVLYIVVHQSDGSLKNPVLLHKAQMSLARIRDHSTGANVIRIAFLDSYGSLWVRRTLLSRFLWSTIAKFV